MAAASNRYFSHFRSRAVSLLAAALPLLTTAACVPPEDTTQSTGAKPPIGGGGAGGYGGDGGQGGGAECPEGATRDCSITLGEHAGVLTCLEGAQTCADGEWGPCAGLQEMKRPAPPPAARRSNVFVKSLSSPVDCLNNPCDPSCQTFQEVPATPVTSPPSNLVAPWNTGDFGGIPPALLTQGSTEPCSSGADCQFDQYCNNPSSGTCSHSKCVPGGGLNSNCDPCVTQICAGNPGCCTTPIQGSCAHDLCVTGTPLVGGATPCDPCVQAICLVGTYTFCCNQATGAWTQDCINQVANVCGKSCSTGTWTQTCADQVKSSCNAHCLEDDTAPACAHDKCYLGDFLDAACDPCVSQICASDPFCCSNLGKWDGLCLQQVATVCGETCPAKGDCLPWLPTETDPDCFGFDLTVGVGCTNNGAKQVPVCNRGTGNAPAGLPIAILPPAPPDELGNCYVPIPGATPIINTPSVIPPGECIDVTLPAGTADGSQIGVNLANAPGFNFSECNCSNNWSLWSSATGACDDPSCAGASAYAKLKKVKLFVAVDRSASQNCTLGHIGNPPCLNTAPTRWDQLKGALASFVTDPSSDSLGIWLRYFPYTTNGSCPGPLLNNCGSTQGCKFPNAEVADLASAANENTLLTLINGVAAGASATPLYPALEGALIAAAAALQADSSLAPAVIMVTDGSPTQCTGSGGGAAQIQQIADLAALYFNAYGIRTYIIGVDVNSTNIQLIAGAGGGKGFAIDAGDPIQTLMLDALDAIKQEFVSCTIDLPDLDIFDPSQATFTYTPGAGAAVTLPEVANQAACGGNDGWYYDDPADPASVTLCPTTCTAVKADSNGSLSLEIACINQYLPSTYSQKYEADCPPGTAPQWGYLAYDTVTPGDSSVAFRVHTSADDVTYGALTAPTLAQATPNTQVCPLAGPAPCPVDLYTALGGIPEARNRYLELQISIQPTSDTNQTPSVNNWQVTYSCPDAE